eukprot:TRINITY_DN1308_c0_g1_i1.p1 TRINITY_DN1308_c0_g1~~TRINITY_DN1308_c0_g1_i1.p1  ORF type:complete len:565 (-),score=146.65 TRINITY_DN1308_c0_g1_i1:47-1741(-)
MDTSETFIGYYKLKRTIGGGTFGKVKVAEHVLSGHKVAVKILNKAKIRTLKMTDQVQREIRILKLFNHPHIVRLYEVIENPQNIFLVMELAAGGELFKHIKKNGKLEEPTARRFFQQIVAGVDYCHRHMVVHRDLKPENILLDAHNNVKVSDFGLSNLLPDGDFLETSCGSPNYAAPEVIDNKPYAGPAIDVWSIGVMLYTMVVGKYPFDGETLSDLFHNIRSAPLHFPPNFSIELKDLILGMLHRDPVSRFSLDDIKRHQWFKNDMPSYIARLLKQPNTEVRSIDNDILDKVAKLHVDKLNRVFDRDKAIRELREGKMSKETVAYYLFQDSDIRTNLDSEDIYDDDHEFSRVAMNTFIIEDTRENGHSPLFDGAPSLDDDLDDVRNMIKDEEDEDNDIKNEKSPMGRTARENFKRKRLPSIPELKLQPLKSVKTIDSKVAPESSGEKKSDQKLEKRKRKQWMIGFRTRFSLADAVRELCLTLKTLNCTWENVSPFEYRVKMVDPNLEVTIEVFRIPEGKMEENLQENLVDQSTKRLLFDIRKTKGSALQFLAFCNALLHSINI